MSSAPSPAGEAPVPLLLSLLRNGVAPMPELECVNSDRYADWTSAVTEDASRAGVNATPTVKMNGQDIENTDAALRQAVEAAS